MNGEQILKILAEYNEKIFPLQYVAYILGFLVLVLACRKSTLSSRIISAIFAMLWLWVAAVFALPYAIDGMTNAIITAVFFFIQGGFFLHQILRPKLHFGTYSKTFTIVGILFVLGAMVGYLIIGQIMGHTYPGYFPFGLAPCPLTVFTLGIYMFTSKKIPKHLLILPFLFSLTGILPVTLGLYEDIIFLLSGLICAPMLYFRDRRLE